MKRKIGIWIFLLTIMILSMMPASAVSTQENETAKHNFSPELINKLEHDSYFYFIAGYGNVPSFTTEEERYQWRDNLTKILYEFFKDNNQKPEPLRYADPIGPVRTFTPTLDGVLVISINNSTTVDKQFMDEFYQIIDSKANEMGVKEIPVAFMRENNLTLDDIESSEFGSKTSEGVVEKTSNLSASEEENTIKSNSSTTNDSNIISENISSVNNSNENKSNVTSSTPGFELLGSLTCLYMGWKLRRK
ncbi:MAG: hypothetical protein QG610_1869 [Euryarchaeota archaeon]|nr:hypothetical protein [Euryarchaeota archaeon]